MNIRGAWTGCIIVEHANGIYLRLSDSAWVRVADALVGAKARGLEESYQEWAKAATPQPVSAGPGPVAQATKEAAAGAKK